MHSQWIDCGESMPRIYICNELRSDFDGKFDKLRRDEQI